MNIIDGVLQAFIASSEGGLKELYDGLEESAHPGDVAHKALNHFHSFWNKYFEAHPITKWGVNGVGDLTITLRGNIELVLKSGEAPNTAVRAAQLFPYKLTLKGSDARQV